MHLRFLFLLPVVLLVACQGERTPRPHVVLIVIDTLRADVMHGGSYAAERPNIGALAQDGVVFPNAFTHAPLTLPSHTSLFSSRLPAETGVLVNGQTVPDDLPLLAEWLGSRGYATRAVVSMGTLLSKGQGLRRGFDVFDSSFSGMADAADTAERLRAALAGRSQKERTFLFAHYSDPHAPYRAHGTAANEARVRWDEAELVRLNASEGRSWDTTLTLEPGTHEIAIECDEIFRVLTLRLKAGGEILTPTWTEGDRGGRQKAARATFEVSTAGEHELTLWLTDVVNNAEKRERYLLEATHADRFVGDLIRELKELGIYDESLIILHSDHGESLGEHGYVGHAQSLADVTLRVPLIVKPPKGHPLASAMESRAKELVSLIDVTPTILAFCAVPPLPGQRGTSFTEKRQAAEHVAQTHKPDAKQDMICFRDERYKMIYVRDEGSFAMYDMVGDPLETQDVYAERVSERPDWPDRLRAVAEAAEAARKGGATDAETRMMLEALGYAGGEQ